MVPSDSSPTEKRLTDILAGPAVAAQRRLNYLITSVPPAWGSFQIRHAVNAHKGLSGVVVFLLMVAFDNYSTTAWIYFALHGFYGVSWLLKDRLYPDAKWAESATLGSFVVTFLMLSLYWLTGFLIVRADTEPGTPVLVLALLVYLAGLVLHHVADAQKYYALEHGAGLITDGLFARTRNPNYLGEMLLYSAFALLASASTFWWVPWLVNGAAWGCTFLPSWIVKDRSLSRYDGWERYRRRTGLLLPKLFRQDD